ncbi:MAG: glycosyltransferase family 9 protein [Acidobacteria bacterium]|nr:glycosyltransferase family 9 protein [Acidobacteriota bacterium]
MTDPLKILIIRLSSLGDILHALPAFAGLRKAFPDAKIDWLAGRPAGFLVSAVSGIDAVHIFDKTAALPLPFRHSSRFRPWKLIQRLRAERYDFCMDFQGLLKTAFLGFMSGAGVRIGFPKSLVREPPAHRFYHRMPAKPAEAVHVLELNRLLAGCVGREITAEPFDFITNEEDTRYVGSLLEKEGLENFVVINPGGGWPSKIWKPERYGRLADRIRRQLNLPVVVTTGPGEEPLYERLAAHCPGKPPVHFQIRFLQLIPLLKRARLLIGGDTGPLHLACACGTPVVGIYGPSCPVRNGPWGKDDEAVYRTLPCSRCYKRTCPADNACMDISVEEIFAAATRRLEKPV